MHIYITVAMYATMYIGVKCHKQVVVVLYLQ